MTGMVELARFTDTDGSYVAVVAVDTGEFGFVCKDVEDGAVVLVECDGTTALREFADALSTIAAVCEEER